MSRLNDIDIGEPKVEDKPVKKKLTAKQILQKAPGSMDPYSGRFSCCDGHWKCYCIGDYDNDL